MEEKIFDEQICYIDPLSDFGFKRVFGLDGCQEELKYMLNLFVSERFGRISEVQYLPNEAVGLDEYDRKVVFDVLCKNEHDDYFVVEMQKIRQRFPIERGLAYASRLISNSITVKDKKYHIAKVCVVCIMEHPDRLALKRGEKVWFVNYKDDFGNIISDNPTFCIVELGIFAREKKVPKTEQEILAHVFNNMRKMTELPQQASGNSFFETMFRRCNYKKFSDMEKDEYKKSIWDYADVQSGMELVRDEAFQDGMEKGIEKGIEKGRAEGEAQSKILIARNMLSKGIDSALISELTGLTEEEIKGIGFRA